MHVSVATVWELTIKSMLGKLRLPGSLTELLETEGFVPNWSGTTLSIG